MAKPEERGARMPQQAEAQRPNHSHSTAMPGRESIAMKLDMLHLVAQDQFAHRLDRLVAAMLPNHPIISGAHDLHDEQDQHLELDSKQAPARVKHAKRKRVGDKLAA